MNQALLCRFRKRVLLAVVCSLLGSASALATDAEHPARPATAREQMNSTLWMQRAAEYRLAATQVWRLAGEKLASSLSAPGTAALEQITFSADRLASLPTAIVVDLDETVLDNTAYQARNVLKGADYDEASWQAWMQEAAAPAVPGSQAFLQAAAAAGHRIIYLTNRRCLPMPPSSDSNSERSVTDPCPAQSWTQANLKTLDLPFAEDPESLLLRGARAEWASSDKRIRRAWVAERYRIIALFGDDLHDFVDRSEFAKRETELSRWFGERWFLLPNPMYGSWDRALVGNACQPGDTAEHCAQKTLDARYRALRP